MFLYPSRSSLGVTAVEERGRHSAVVMWVVLMLAAVSREREREERRKKEEKSRERKRALGREGRRPKNKGRKKKTKYPASAHQNRIALETLKLLIYHLGAVAMVSSSSLFWVLPSLCSLLFSPSLHNTALPNKVQIFLCKPS